LIVRYATVLLASALSLAARADGAGDPFDTDSLRPPSAASEWAAEPTERPCDGGRALPSALTLADAVDLALCRNPRTRETWAAARVAAAQLGVARGARLPTVTGTLNAQTSESRAVFLSGRRDSATAGLSFNWLLFDFGGRDAAIEQARQALFAADWTHNATLQAVVLETGQAYFQSFAAEQAVDAARAAERFALQGLDAARTRQKAGTATRADVLQAQTAWSQAVLTRTQAEGDAAIARGVLANTMGLPAQSTPTLAAPGEVADAGPGEAAVAALMDEAMNRRPELRAAEAGVAAARAAVTVEESAGRPTLSISSSPSVGVMTPGTDPRNINIGLSVNIPLFLGYQNTYRIRAARDSVDRSSAARDRLRNDISLEVWRSWQDVRTQGQAVLSAGDLVRSATESHEMALGRYRAGVGSVIDLLSAQTALLQAAVQQIQTRLRLNVSKLALARAIGTLDPSLFADRPAATSR
jgi:outer membrane protein TolC